MKLYTEEHLKIFYSLGKVDGFIGRQDDVNELIKNYPPIELPTDEEIEEFSYAKYMEVEDSRWFEPLKVGAKWMRDKIGGNNE